ncbi:MAG: FISUMP domain-containing protein [Bacteroidales bacterium]
MKRSFTLSALILFSVMLFPPRQAGAQAPDRMSYQAVIRNAANELVTGQEVGMQISILQGSPEGPAVYIETQAPVTSANGLVSIEIGGDDATILSGDFAAIDWSAGPYFIKTETDPSGGTDYTITGTSQLLSVPYAFHARTAEDITGEITESRITDLQDYLLSETDPVFTSWDRSTGIEITESQVSDLQDYLTSEADPLFMESAAGGITEADTAAWNNKSDFSGDYHSLTNTPDIADSIDIYGFSGNYDDLAGAPGLATVATSGDYADLENRPASISDLALDAGSQKITSLASPDDDADAATKAYVDMLISELTDKIETLETHLFGCGTVTFMYRGAEVTYATVAGQNGTCWMDRNLGATRSAQVYDDSESFGDLFQWGRLNDGHQDRSSSTTSELSTSDDPEHGDFITNNSPPYDWRDPANENLWQGDGGINDVCPAGWRLPTEEELDNERQSWSSNDQYGAFHSNLKLPAAGKRSRTGNVLMGSSTNYWSSTVSENNPGTSLSLMIGDDFANMTNGQRAEGKSVRCIKDY